MTPERITHFRGILEARRDELTRRIRATQAQARAVLDGGEATDDLGERSDAADSGFRIGERLTQDHHDVEDALLRIERGDFGACEACGRAIEDARLDVLPSARLCEADARAADRGRATPSL